MDAGEVAAFACVPFVVLFDGDRAGEARQRGRVGEYPDDVGAAFDFFVDPLERVRGPDLAPILVGEGREGEKVVAGVGEHACDFRWERSSIRATSSNWAFTCF